MTINDTVQLMTSDDYRKRFIAEYWQTKNRYDALHRMTIRYEAGTLDFKPSCSLELLKEQKMHMGQYLRVLEIRAEIEKINLYESLAVMDAIQTLRTERVEEVACGISGGNPSISLNGSYPVPSYYTGTDQAHVASTTHAVMDGSITAHS